LFSAQLFFVTGSAGLNGILKCPHHDELEIPTREAFDITFDFARLPIWEVHGAISGPQHGAVVGSYADTIVITLTYF
jgi:hypothetical protein